MSKFGPASAFVLISGNNLTPHSYTMDEVHEQILEETHSLGDSWEESLPVGIGRVAFELTGGLYDDAALGPDETFKVGTSPLTPTSTVQLLAIGFEAATPGKNCRLYNGTYAGTYKRMSARDGLTKAHALHTITGAALDAKVLHGHGTAETAASGNTEGADSVNNGGSSAGGGTADLHVTALTLGGYTDATIKVRDSADDITYGDFATFTNVSAASASERVTVAGTVEQYAAVSWLFNGAGAGQSINFFVALSRG